LSLASCFSILREVSDLISERRWLDFAEMHPRLSHAGQILKRIYIKFRDDECTKEANAMAYRTLFSVVPLLAIFLTIFTAFKAFNEFRGRVLYLLSEYLVPSAKGELIEHFSRMADNTRTLSSISLVGTLIVALYLFDAIEVTFNRIWEVSEKRRFLRKFTVFTAILLWSPVFLGLSFYLTTFIQSNLPWLKAVTQVSVFSRFILRLLPVFFTWAALTIMYAVVPHTKVDVRTAAIGALVASLGWEVVKVGFNFYVVYAVNYSKIYGSLSVIPIFIIGLYLLWVVVFLGAEITYVIYNYRYHEEWSEHERIGYKPYLAVGAMLEIGRRFQRGERPPNVEEFARLFRIAIPVLKEVLNALKAAGILSHSDDDLYSPARNLSLITLEDVINATIEKAAVINRQGRSAQRIIQKMSSEEAGKLAEIFNSLETEMHKTLGEITLDDLITQPKPPVDTLNGKQVKVTG